MTGYQDDGVLDREWRDDGGSEGEAGSDDGASEVMGCQVGDQDRFAGFADRGSDWLVQRE
jgi:hypothetical protein